MGKIENLLKTTAHRPVGLPDGSWRYYQQWNDVLFFHWQVDADILRPLLPDGLELDLFEGSAYLSLVPFTMQKIRPRLLPAFAPVSDFHEINLRTYVTRDGKSGVYFINIEAQKGLSAWLSRNLSGLPYEKAAIQRSQGRYVSSNAYRNFFLDIEFAILEKIEVKSELEKFLTERYALFLQRRSQLYRYDIHHKEWEIHSVDLKKLRLDYRLPGLELLGKPPDLTHYSSGVEVIAWKKTTA